jgi:hypothetical protein
VERPLTALFGRAKRKGVGTLRIGTPLALD